MVGPGRRIFKKLSVIVLLAATAASSRAADFDLSATIRAGLSNAAQWELGIGATATPTSVASLLPYHPNNVSRQFQLGYTSATNTAFLRYYHNSATFQQINFSPGGRGLGAGALWTIPLGSMFVSASRRPRLTSITVDRLSLGGGVQVLQPFSSTTLTAAQNGTSVTVAMGSPVMFRTGATGDWLMSGRISFGGLSAYVPGGANQTDLQFRAELMGDRASVPEPPVSGLLALGLIAIGLRARQGQGQGGARP